MIKKGNHQKKSTRVEILQEKIPFLVYPVGGAAI